MIKNERTNRKRRNENGRFITETEAHPGERDRTRQNGRFTVLFVCSANLCRSVTAATLIERHLDGAAKSWRFESAGLNVDPGNRIPAPCVPVMDDHEIPTDHTARPLSAAMVEAADLIVTADREQRGAIVRSVPSSKRRVFTLRQLSRFAAAGRDAEGLSEIDEGPLLLDAVASGRISVQPVDPEADDIVDPATRPSEAGMKACIEMIQCCIDDMLG